MLQLGHRRKHRRHGVRQPAHLQLPHLNLPHNILVIHRSVEVHHRHRRRHRGPEREQPLQQIMFRPRDPLEVPPQHTRLVRVLFVHLGAVRVWIVPDRVELPAEFVELVAELRDVAAERD